MKVGLLELGQFIEIRILAYLRVANLKPFSNKQICDALFQIRRSSLYLFAVRIT